MIQEVNGKNHAVLGVVLKPMFNEVSHEVERDLWSNVAAVPGIAKVKYTAVMYGGRLIEGPMPEGENHAHYAEPGKPVEPRNAFRYAALQVTDELHAQPEKIAPVIAQLLQKRGVESVHGPAFH